MRINSNSGAQPLPQSARTGNQGTAAADARGAAAGSPLGEDLAQLSGAHVQVQALAAQALQFPEVRQEKVSALRQVVLDGSYQPAAKQVADAVFAHLVVTPAA